MSVSNTSTVTEKIYEDQNIHIVEFKQEDDEMLQDVVVRRSSRKHKPNMKYEQHAIHLIQNTPEYDRKRKISFHKSSPLKNISPEPKRVKTEIKSETTDCDNADSSNILVNHFESRDSSFKSHCNEGTEENSEVYNNIGKSIIAELVNSNSSDSSKQEKESNAQTMNSDSQSKDIHITSGSELRRSGRARKSSHWLSELTMDTNQNESESDCESVGDVSSGSSGSAELISSSDSSEYDDSEDEYEPVSRKGRQRTFNTKKTQDVSFPNKIKTDSANLLKSRGRKSEYPFMKPEKKEAGTPTGYKSGPNLIYIPQIKEEMIKKNGDLLQIVCTETEQFKFKRDKVMTKEDHAEPEKVRAIIAAVRKRPIIWDQRLESHRKLRVSALAWEQIEKELGPDPRYPLRRRKQIWKNKKDYFVNTTNGGTTASNWEFYEDLLFYLPVVNYTLNHTVRTAEDDNKGLGEKFMLTKDLKFSQNDAENVLKYVLHSWLKTANEDVTGLAKLCDRIKYIFSEIGDEKISSIPAETDMEEVN